MSRLLPHSCGRILRCSCRCGCRRMTLSLLSRLKCHLRETGHVDCGAAVWCQHRGLSDTFLPACASTAQASRSPCLTRNSPGRSDKLSTGVASSRKEPWARKARGSRQDDASGGRAAAAEAARQPCAVQRPSRQAPTNPVIQSAAAQAMLGRQGRFQVSHRRVPRQLHAIALAG